jgi:hypothetical protein
MLQTVLVDDKLSTRSTESGASTGADHGIACSATTMLTRDVADPAAGALAVTAVLSSQAIKKCR